MAYRYLAPETAHSPCNSLDECRLIKRHIRTTDFLVATHIFVFHPGVQINLTGQTKYPATQAASPFSAGDRRTEIQQAGLTGGSYQNILLAFQVGMRNSGSMRGRPITVAAISADILARTLERCGVKVEILGFTTRAWKGGSAREKWVAENKPANPGRLNDLRHIVYKAAEAPWRRARRR